MRRLAEVAFLHEERHPPIAEIWPYLKLLDHGMAIDGQLTKVVYPR